MPRDGTKNLIPFDQRTKEEQREIATAGGIASGVARRRKRAMKELFDIALERSPTKASNREELAAFYEVQTKDVTAGMAIVHKAIERAERGNTRAMEFVRDTSGNKLADQLEVSTAPVSEQIAAIENYVADQQRRESDSEDLS